MLIQYFILYSTILSNETMVLYKKETVLSFRIKSYFYETFLLIRCFCFRTAWIR